MHNAEAPVIKVQNGPYIRLMPSDIYLGSISCRFRQNDPYAQLQTAHQHRTPITRPGTATNQRFRRLLPPSSTLIPQRTGWGRLLSRNTQLSAASANLVFCSVLLVCVSLFGGFIKIMHTQDGFKMYHQQQDQKHSPLVVDVIPPHYNMHHNQPSPPESPNTTQYTKGKQNFLFGSMWVYIRCGRNEFNFFGRIPWKISKKK